MSETDLDQVVELALRLSLPEQLRLIAQIGEKLSQYLEPGMAGQATVGSAAAVIHAMRAPPSLEDQDVDELERSIQEGRISMRYDGVFGQGTDG